MVGAPPTGDSRGAGLSNAVALPRTQAQAAMAVAALMIAHQVAGKAARDGIFLSQFSSASLPVIVAAAAALSILSSLKRGRTLARIGPQRITAMSFAASALLHALEWALLPHHPRIAACAIYLHVVAFGAILLSGFWSLMNESFDPRSAKQVFGRISGMGTLGGLMGGVLAERVAAWISPAAVVLALAILHLLCAGLLWRAFPHTQPREGNEAAGSTAIQALRRYPFLLTVAGLLLAVSIGTALLDFVFKAQAAQTIGKGASLVRFFGLYYTGTSLLVFLVQTTVTRFALEHGGLAASAGTLPASIAAGSVLAFLTPGFPALAAVRGLEILTRGSVFRAAYELFYTAVAPAEKRAVKSVIDVGVDRLGDAIGAGAVSVFLFLTPARYGGILLSATVAAGVALALAIRLRTGYLVALEKSLLNRAVELDPALIEDGTTRSVLMKTAAPRRQPTAPSIPVAAAAPKPEPARIDAFLRLATELRSGDPARVTAAAGKVAKEDWAAAPLLINLLAWDPAMEAARDALRRIGPGITGMLTDVLLDVQGDFTIRRRIPRILAYIPDSRAVDGLFAALDDSRFEVRFYAARALYLLLRDHRDLSVAPDRIWAAVQREISTQRSMWQKNRLLDTRGTQDADWYFDEELQDRADRNLEHLFTLLSMLLPGDAVRIAFRALHSEDRQLRGTAFEYLESATPQHTRRALLELLESGSRASA
jgi:hypothetical protein